MGGGGALLVMMVYGIADKLYIMMACLVDWSRQHH
jgi:hypothetical protein